MPEPMPDPTPGRPRRMQGYGVPDSVEGALPWSWAEERLAASRNYWVSTADLVGVPHAAPVWGVWVVDGLYFDTTVDSKKARNLAVNPRVVVATEDGREAVIVHGRAERLEPSALTERYDEAYRTKYGSGAPGTRYLVRPSHAFGFIEHDAQFAQTATRWTFEGREALA